MARCGAEGPGIADDGCLQQRFLVGGVFTHLRRAVLRVVPGVHPRVLVEAGEERLGFHIARVFDQDGLVGAPGVVRPLQALQADAALAGGLQIGGVEAEGQIELLQGVVIVPPLEQGRTCLEPGLHPQGGDRRLVGQHQHILRSAGLAGFVDEGRPGIVAMPVLPHGTDAQALPVGLTQIGEQPVHRAHRAFVPGRQGGDGHVGDGLAVVGQMGRVGRAVLQVVGQLAVGVDVEGLGVARPLDEDHPAGPQGVAHPQFVPHVGVVDAQVGHHQIGHQQLLEHVQADVPGPLLLVGPQHLQPRILQGRLDQFIENAVEVDLLTLVVRLGAEGHCHEGMEFHGGVPGVEGGDPLFRIAREALIKSTLAKPAARKLLICIDAPEGRWSKSAPL